MELVRIQNTLNFIEENYNTSISIEDLEKISCCSYRNLQRIIKHSCGETIGAYQIRLKLENAYKLILYSKESLSEIAHKVGFESISSFSKSFKKQFKISPREARQKRVEILKKSALTLNTSTIQLTSEIIFLPAIKVYYQSARTNYINEEIEALWDSFSSNEFPQKSLDYFGVIADEPLITEQIICRYDACCTDQPMNKKFPSKTILGRKYVKFIHQGNYNSINETYKAIYSGWILSSLLAFDNSPIIERYVNHSSNVISESEYLTEILLPLL